MPVLDATAIADECDIIEQTAEDRLKVESSPTGQVDSEQSSDTAKMPPLPLKSITLPVPDNCETNITLFFQQDPSDKYWANGFSIKRLYETSPYEEICELMPRENEGFASLVAAIENSVQDVDSWLSLNSDDNDEKASETLAFLANWFAELDPNELESMLESSVLKELINLAEKETDEKTAEICQIAENAIGVLTSVPLVNHAVSDDAQKHFDECKHLLEEEIGRLSIEDVDLRIAIKTNREARIEATENLIKLKLTGPEKLPLFDQQRNSQGGNLVQTPPGCSLFEQSTTKIETNNKEKNNDTQTETDDAWEKMTVEELGLSLTLCGILREENSIGNMGQLADWTREYALTDLKKIGKAKAQLIEDAQEKYWARQ